MTLQEHRKLLQSSTESPDFKPTKASGLAAGSEAALVPVASALYLLKRDVVWGRFSPSDFAKLHEHARRLVVRATGMCAYFGAIDPTRERFPTTAGPSAAGTPPQTTSPPSPPDSVNRETTEEDITEKPHIPLEQTSTVDSSITPVPSETSPDGSLQPGSIRNARRRNVGTRHPRFSEPRGPSIHHAHIHHRPHHRHKHPMTHGPLLPLVTGKQNPTQSPVGLYESIRYADLEEKLSYPSAASNTEKFHILLKESCDDILGVADGALETLAGWLNTVTSKSRFKFWRNSAEHQKAEQERIDAYVQAKEKLDGVLEVFEKEKRWVVDACHFSVEFFNPLPHRHLVVDPYRAFLDPKEGNGETSDAPSHRHLFHCYTYQYHLWQFAKVLSEVVCQLLLRILCAWLTQSIQLGEVIHLENERKDYKLWMPTLPWKRLLARDGLGAPPDDDVDNHNDEDPGSPVRF